MKLLKLSLLFFLMLLFTACSPTTYKINESKLIIIKTPKLKYADLGYIRKNKNELRIDLFIAGQLVKSIEIDTLVCVDEGCMRKTSFNEEFLHVDYHYNILKDIFMARPIFEEENIIFTDDGFEQNIKTQAYDIVYRVGKEKVYFKDKQNKILIKIKNTKG